jgi:hypothetical protein
MRSSIASGDFRRGLRAKRGDSYLLHSEYQELSDVEVQRITRPSDTAADTSRSDAATLVANK